MNRRSFLNTCACASGGIAVMSSGACFSGKRMEETASYFQISLAEWSLHRAIFFKEIEHLDFAGIAKHKFGISNIEYSDHFFKDHVKNLAYLDEMNLRAGDVGVRQLLIMIDVEGSLGDLDPTKRNKAVENHYKWVEAANRLGCHSIRVNAHGVGSSTEVMKAAVDGLRSLSQFAQDYGLNVIVENHGGFSSDGLWLSYVMKQVDMKNCGTLPDFGNFCLEYKEDQCVDEYDRYKGVQQLMPYAKAVSAKTFDFDDNGNETSIDFIRMMKIVKDSGYQGFVGIEYEGDRLSEFEGIKASKQLLQKVALEL